MTRDISNIPQGEFDYPYVYYKTDRELAAYDLGWEYRRRERPITDNPFHPELEKWQWFRDGWKAFDDTGLRRRKKSPEA